MNSIEKIQEKFKKHIKDLYKLEDSALNFETILQVDSNKKEFGDLSSNVAMVLSKLLKKNPRELAQELVQSFKDENIAKLEIAGPGFINFYLNKPFYEKLVKEIAVEQDQFFKPSVLDQTRFNVEFVSANPTGPLHLGHGRGGIIGDVLSKVISFLGYKATKEFYVNDAGNQIYVLGQSFKARCMQLLNIEMQIPEGGYQGQYLVELAKKVVDEYGKDLIEKNDEFFADFAKDHLLEDIKNTLANYAIEYDVWFSEKSLHVSGAIEKALEILDSRGQTYWEDDALWIRTTAYGDDKDRVLKKRTGELTYAAADVAYMKNKFDRKFDKLIYVLGQDHHSYVIRLKSIAQALGYNADQIDVILYQLVTLKESDTVLKMSKRAGRGIFLKDVIDTVGKDVARFFYLNKKAEAHLEFDVELALKNTEQNPVFYIQYAYVRTKSILEKVAAIEGIKEFGVEDLKNLTEAEVFLIKKICQLKHILMTIKNTYQTHLLTYYVHELAAEFHSYYYANRVIDEKNPEISKARLALVKLLKEHFERIFKLMGITEIEKM